MKYVVEYAISGMEMQMVRWARELLKTLRKP